MQNWTLCAEAKNAALFLINQIINVGVNKRFCGDQFFKRVYFPPKTKMITCFFTFFWRSTFRKRPPHLVKITVALFGPYTPYYSATNWQIQNQIIVAA